MRGEKHVLLRTCHSWCVCTVMSLFMSSMSLVLSCADMSLLQTCTLQCCAVQTCTLQSCSVMSTFGAFGALGSRTRAQPFQFSGTKTSPPRANARTFSTRTRAVQAHFNFSLLMYINSTPANFDLAGCSGFLWRLWFTLPRAPLVLLSKHFDALVRPRAMAL